MSTPHTELSIDPWFEGNTSANIGSDSLGKMDMVLVTHDHDDHLGQAAEICKRTGAMACGLLGCKSVVPMHWGTFPVLEQDTEHFRVELETVSPETSQFAMYPGQSVELS